MRTLPDLLLSEQTLLHKRFFKNPVYSCVVLALLVMVQTPHLTTKPQTVSVWMLARRNMLCSYYAHQMSEHHSC